MKKPWIRPWITKACPNVGAELGSASIIIIDDSVSIDWLVNKTVRFFKHESCGKCTPCREGTYWMKHLITAYSTPAKGLDDVDLLYDVASQIKGKCLCALGEFSIEAVLSGMSRFRPDFDRKLPAPGTGKSLQKPPDARRCY
jgi:NADH-quinone oxidoreductase subunit F